jgi:spermidine/putrescine transport system substrate-binding protein
MHFRNLLAIALLFMPVLGQSVLAADKVLPSPQRTLVILNWSEYLDPELVARFEQAHNARISEVYFESDDLRDDMLLESDGRGYDLAVVSGPAIDTYQRRNWLAPLDQAQFPNYKHINEHWVNAFPAAHGYAVPFFWGTSGIAYRSDLVTTPPTSWMDILKPDESMRGKIAMVESSRDLMTVALKAQGYSTNTTDSAEIKAAGKLLLEQKPYVKSYNYLALNEESALVSGEVVAALMYSGDALVVQEHNENIEYVLPEEGGNIWVDYFVVLEQSRKKDLAHAFLNFINEPENARQMAEFVYYATPNKAAEKLLPAEFLEDPVIYPSEAALAISEFHNPLPPRATKKRNLAIAKVLK